MSIDLHPGVRPVPAPAAPARPVAARQTTAPTRWWRTRRTAVLAVHALCLGIILLGSRVAFLHNSIRLDEAQSLWQTDHSYGYLLHLVAEDVHPPLYHVLLRTWRLVFGPDIETARIRTW